MNDLIKNYEPINSEDQLYLWLGALVGVVAFGAMTFVIRKEFPYEEQSKKWLIALLFFIVGLIASGTAFFSWLTVQKVGSVKIYSDHVELGKTKVLYEDIKVINIKKEEEKSFVNPNIVRKEYNLLFIQEMKGKVYVVSERSYPVREVLNELRQAIDLWKKKRGSEEE